MALHVDRFDLEDEKISVVSFVDDLAARLKQPLPGAEAQLKMAPNHPGARPLTKDAPANVKHAAALILLYPGAGTEVPAYEFPLTVRRPDLLHHPGQISLPGGGLDHGEMHEAAALREAEEEIGVDPSTVRILGALTPLYVIVSGFVVSPFVGVVDTRPNFRPEAREVAEILEVPVGVLLDPSRRARGTKTREGYKLDFPYFAVGDSSQHQVWGATAMILTEFAELLG
jgi:8-oxo-dGTP pyrophosphatase MutT (NUDIX family)